GQGRRAEARAGDPRLPRHAGHRADAAAGGRHRLRSPARQREPDRSDQRSRRLHQSPAEVAMKRALVIVLALGTPAAADPNVPVNDIEVPTVIIETGETTTAGGDE